MSTKKPYIEEQIRYLLSTYEMEIEENLILEEKGVKSNFFGQDLAVFRKNYSQG